MRKFLIAFLIGSATAILCFGLTATTLAQFNSNVQQNKLNAAAARGIAYLQTNRAALGLTDADELNVKRALSDEQGLSHIHVQQTVKGIPVFGGEAIVHQNAKGDVMNVTNSLQKRINLRSLLPSFDAATAAQFAIQKYGCNDCLTAVPQTDLFILRQGKQDLLVYRVELRREDNTENTALPVYFVNANTGNVVLQYDNLQTASVNGTGVSLYDGTVNIVEFNSGSTYYIEDIGRKVGSFTFRNGTTSAYRYTNTSSSWTTADAKAGVEAHYGAEAVIDYYSTTHGRNGIDGKGGPAYYTSIDGKTGLISSIVHYSTSYNNAFWNGQYMTYGDGDGTTFTPLVTLDICGHEMTHGVTQNTANLTYLGESGALNEAVSDIFGSMVERYKRGESANTWLIGEDAYTPATAGDALRYMNNPTRGNQPDYYPNRYLGSADNGGVHKNSGIANYAFYLLAKGGTTSRGASVTGIGADKAAKIWYKALTAYMTSGTTFSGARTATINAANAIYGANSAESTAVGKSWTAVGVN